MNFLWLTWKDRSNPLAGGAELVNEEFAKRLAADGHTVVFLVAGFPGCEPKQQKDGFKIIRLGNRWSVYWQAYRYYKKNLQGWPDLVIDEVNTIPFFAQFYVNSRLSSSRTRGSSVRSQKPRVILFIHQLCREIWFYEMFFPLNIIGYVFEPIYLWLLRDKEVITVSESTKKDLIKIGFKEEKINIISEGIEIEPLATLDGIEKYDRPTILSLGSIRAMKRTHHIIKAFEIAKEEVSNLQLVVAGQAEGRYGKKILKMIENSTFKNDIKYLGKISKDEKILLLQKSHVLAVTSIREGWGLTVTEANSQGTPAVVYDVPGLRDSVRDGETGWVCEKSTPGCLASMMVSVIEGKNEYEKMRRVGLGWSGEVNFERGNVEFINCIV